MITGIEFKKQISRGFGVEMRGLGFKGTGLNYFQETEEFLFCIYIELGRWGGKCTTGFAIHPKVIKKNSEGPLNLKKLKIYEYEFKMNLSKYARGKWWDYNNDREVNLRTLSKIVKIIKEKAIPVINLFKASPSFLDNFTVSELKSFYTNFTKKTGVTIFTTEERFAWAMTLIFENKNLAKAKQFAKFGLSQPYDDNEPWFGDVDFKRVLSKEL